MLVPSFDLFPSPYFHSLGARESQEKESETVRERGDGGGGKELTMAFSFHQIHTLKVQALV
jgi:hypothetical protein